MKNDPVNHPSHYTTGPLHSACGKPIECIEITRHMCFDLGNAVKYIWRADHKGSKLQDLQKALWYIQDQIAMIKAEEGSDDYAPS